MLGMAWIKCTEEAYKKCPFSNTCGDAENAIFMDGSDCDKFNQSLNPYTVDAVPVVRCKGCKHAEQYARTDGTAGYYCGHPKNAFVYGERWDRVFKPVKNPDDFCSFGEPKEVE